MNPVARPESNDLGVSSKGLSRRAPLESVRHYGVAVGREARADRSEMAGNPAYNRIEMRIPVKDRRRHCANRPAFAEVQIASHDRSRMIGIRSRIDRDAPTMDVFPTMLSLRAITG